MNDFEITPIFPSTICSSILSEDLEIYYEQIIERTIFKETYYGSGSQVSDDFNLLEKYLHLKNEIESKFLEFKDSVLKLKTTSFKMTTSWATKCPPNSNSQKHSHKNSYYSGVLYLTEHSDNAPIMFFNPIDDFNTILTNNPTEYNGFNSRTWTIHPQKGKIIFFPSYLEHMILKNISQDNRYSIAFNFFPSGTIGLNDSRIDLIL